MFVTAPALHVASTGIVQPTAMTTAHTQSRLELALESVVQTESALMGSWWNNYGRVATLWPWTPKQPFLAPQ